MTSGALSFFFPDMRIYCCEWHVFVAVFCLSPSLRLFYGEDDCFFCGSYVWRWVVQPPPRFSGSVGFSTSIQTAQLRTVACNRQTRAIRG